MTNLFPACIEAVTASRQQLSALARSQRDCAMQIDASLDAIRQSQDLLARVRWLYVGYRIDDGAQVVYDKSMTTSKNVRRDALRRQQKADLRSLRLAFIATLPHGKETHGLASAMTLIDASIRAQPERSVRVVNGDPDAIEEKA